MLGSLRLAFVLVALPATIGAGFAWTPPNVGTACSASSHVSRGTVAGNFMGSPTARPGIASQLSFQACFDTPAHCAEWLADKAAHYPYGVRIATCAPVRLG